MATYALTVDGNTRSFQEGSLLITEAVNEQAVLRLDVYSDDASWRPSLDEEVIFTEDGTRIFGGVVTQARESAPGGIVPQGGAQIITEVSAVDFGIYASYRYVVEEFSAPTLKAALTTLVTNYLTGFGISLDSGQATGPTLPDLSYDYKRLDEVLNEWSTLTGYAWEVTYDKELRMFLPSGESAPFNVAEGDGNTIGDIAVTPTRGPYANRILVKAGTNTILDKTETFDGDDSTTEFFLNYTLVYQPQVGYGYVTYAGNYETLDLAGQGATWVYDPDANSITRSSAPVTGTDNISITFPAQFPFTVISEDTGEQTAFGGIVERIIAAPDVYDFDVSEDIADAELSKGTTTLQQVEYVTPTVGIRPGQTQTINLSKRNINTTFTVTEVRSRDQVGSLVHRTVTTVAGTSVRDTWRKVYQDWLGGSTSAGSVAPASTGGAVASPNRAIQYNNGGTPGGSAKLLADPDEGGDTYDGSAAIVAVLPPDDDPWSILVGNNTASDIIGLRITDADLGVLWHSGYNNDGTGGTYFQYFAEEHWFFSKNNNYLGVGNTATDFTALRGMGVLQALAGRVERTTSTSYTLNDSTGKDLLYFFNPASAATVALPAIANTNVEPETGYSRVLFLVNESTSNTVTLNPDGSETISIFGSAESSLDLEPGQAVVLASGVAGGSTGWHVMASTGFGTALDKSLPLLTADPSSPANDTWWAVRDGGSPQNVAVKARISGTTYTIAAIEI